MCFSVFILVLEKEQKMFLLISSTYFFKNPTKFLKLKKMANKLNIFIKKLVDANVFDIFSKLNANTRLVLIRLDFKQIF
jgi:uncharacterized protein YbcI